jgi:hypothetical protein
VQPTGLTGGEAVCAPRCGGCVQYVVGSCVAGGTELLGKWMPCQARSTRRARPVEPERLYNYMTRWCVAEVRRQALAHTKLAGRTVR